MKKVFNKTVYRIICFIIVAFIIFIWIFMIEKQAIKNQVCFEKKCFDVELAETDEARQLWLMYRESLDEKNWMLFLFPQESIHAFWMKNTLIPLDIIRIKKSLQDGWIYNVVDIKTVDLCTTPECETYIPNWLSQYVLEINAWLAEKYDIKVWDNLYLDIHTN